MHFGQVVSPEEWAAIRDRLIALGHKLRACKDETHVPGGRAKLLVADPSGNLVEINAVAP